MQGLVTQKPEVIEGPVKDVLRLIDPDPVLDDELIALGKWISGYYCSPLGSVLETGLPAAHRAVGGRPFRLQPGGVAGEMHHGGDQRTDCFINGCSCNRLAAGLPTSALCAIADIPCLLPSATRGVSEPEVPAA